MRGPHTRDLRERAVLAYERGEGSYETISSRFGVGVATLRRWVRTYRSSGRLEPLPRGGEHYSAIQEQDVAQILKAHPDATAVEIAAAYNKGRRGKNRLHVSSIKRALHRFGYAVKKNAFAPPNNSDLTWRQSGRGSFVR